MGPVCFAIMQCLAPAHTHTCLLACSCQITHILQQLLVLQGCSKLSSTVTIEPALTLLVLCRVRSDLQDHVIMLLRKMMYRQDVSGR